MKSLLLAATLLLMPAALHAQIAAVYGTLSVPHISNVVTGGGPATTSFFAPGIGGGVTVNVIPAGPVRVGFDLRGSTKPGTNGADTALAGIKVAFKAPGISLKPYVEAAGGYLRIRVNATSPFSGTLSPSLGAYQILAGGDIPIAPFLDFRILEVGFGRGYYLGAAYNSTNPTLFTLNSGLVVHF